MPSPELPRKHRGYNAALFAVVLGTALYGMSGPATDTLSNLTRYCSACWRNARLPIDAWPDATQEVFVRLLERMPADSWDDALRSEGEERKELLRAIDCVKKRVQRAKTAQALPEEGVADDSYRGELAQADVRQQIARAANEVLSERQRQILRLWAEGHDVGDMAEKLNMTAARVSDEKYKAVRKLREHLGVV